MTLGFCEVSPSVGLCEVLIHLVLSLIDAAVLTTPTENHVKKWCHCQQLQRTTTHSVPCYLFRACSQPFTMGQLQFNIKLTAQSDIVASHSPDTDPQWLSGWFGVGNSRASCWQWWQCTTLCRPRLWTFPLLLPGQHAQSWPDTSMDLASQLM